MQRITLILLSVLISFTSCNIEKRVHMPGYHVNYHKKASRPIENAKSIEPKSESFEIAIIDLPNHEEQAKEQEFAINNSLKQRTPQRIKELFQRPIKAIESSITHIDYSPLVDSDSKHSLHQNADDPVLSEEYNRTAARSFFTFLASITFLIITFFSVFAFPIPVANIALALCALFFILSLVFSLRARFQIAKQPEKYNRKSSFLTIPSLISAYIIGIIGVIFGIVLMAVLWSVSASILALLLTMISLLGIILLTNSIRKSSRRKKINNHL